MATIKLLIAGGRFFNRATLFREQLYKYLKECGVQRVPQDVQCLVCGMCPTGADDLGYKWANAYNIAIDAHPADWDGLGKAAGPQRNKDMAKACTHALIFWDGKSRGTANMIEELRKLNKPFKIVRYDS